MRAGRPFPARQRAAGASALLIVFWAIFVLAAAIIGFSQWIARDLSLDNDANRALEARAMAHSGMAVGLNPAVSRQTPLLVRDFSQVLGYHVRMLGEGGRLNLNWLLAGQDPRKMRLLRDWLEVRGLDFHERDVFVDSLLDYTSPVDLRRANAVPETDDYHPPHRPLLNVEEIAQVGGAGPLLRSPAWKDNLTIYSQGPIDLASAPMEILRLLPGLSEPRIEQFLKYRLGPDQIEGTVDDPKFKSVEEAFSFLGLSAAAAQQISDLVMVNDPTLHLTSEGHSVKVTRQLEVVARKGAGNPQILRWQE